MVAMDFFAALNCYDFLNQYCSNLLKNPTVRGLMSIPDFNLGWYNIDDGSGGMM